MNKNKTVQKSKAKYDDNLIMMKQQGNEKAWLGGILNVKEIFLAFAGCVKCLPSKR